MLVILTLRSPHQGQGMDESNSLPPCATQSSDLEVLSRPGMLIPNHPAPSISLVHSTLSFASVKSSNRVHASKLDRETTNWLAGCGAAPRACPWLCGQLQPRLREPPLG